MTNPTEIYSDYEVSDWGSDRYTDGPEGDYASGWWGVYIELDETPFLESSFFEDTLDGYRDGFFFRGTSDEFTEEDVYSELNRMEEAIVVDVYMI